MKKLAETILERLGELRKKDEIFLIAIDGRCASGKTTLAAYLQKGLSCNVIHMDHFFLRPEQRTAKRLEEPGGNVDYERFLEEVLIPLKKGQDFSYLPYDCRSKDFGAPVSIHAGAVNIIEGSYSCHPALRDYYDVRIFLSVSPDEQLARIRQRNGGERAADFINKWIPLEERYFLSCQVGEHCDWVYQS